MNWLIDVILEIYNGIGKCGVLIADIKSTALGIARIV